MRSKVYISLFQRIGVLVFALTTMIGSITIASNTTPLNNQTWLVEDYQTSDESSDNDETVPEITVASFQAIINFIHIDLHFTSYLIQELVKVSEIIHQPAVDQIKDGSTYYRTLFRRIISPNAP